MAIDAATINPSDPQNEEEMLWLRDRDMLPPHLKEAIAHIPVTFGVQGSDLRVSNDPTALAQNQLEQSGLFQSMVNAKAQELAAQMMREAQQGQMNVASGENTGRESNAPVEVTHGSNPEPAANSGSEDDENVPPYSEWAPGDLRAELMNRNLDPKGKKDDLVSRLEEDDRNDAGKSFEDEGENEKSNTNDDKS